MGLVDHQGMSMGSRRLKNPFKILAKYIILFLDSFYRSIVKNHLGHGCCRHSPSCSSYVTNSFQEKSLFKAIFLSSKRLLSCHPWGKGTYLKCDTDWGLQHHVEFETCPNNNINSRK